MRTKEQLIAEAVRLGIVEGALIASPASADLTEYVRPISEWVLFPSGNLNNGPTGLYIAFGDRWATVITPAPVVEEEGLKEGDACECGPAMRVAIMELAKGLGVGVYGDVRGDEHWAICVHLYEGRVAIGSDLPASRTKLKSHDFIRGLEATAAKPKPIKIGNDVVKFNTGSITVGCTTIDNATVKAIAEKLID